MTLSKLRSYTKKVIMKQINWAGKRSFKPMPRHYRHRWDKEFL